MSDRFLKDFILIGGTALSLQIGNRKSFDFDLTTVFTGTDLGMDQLKSHLEANYKFQKSFESTNFLFGKFRDGPQSFKVDFVLSPPAPFNKPYLIQEGIRLASLEDIAAMKLNTLRNKKQTKHCFDIACLSEKFSLNQMLDFHAIRYPTENRIDVVRKLTADELPIEGNITLLEKNMNITAHAISTRLEQMASNANTIFPPFIVYKKKG